MLFLLCSHFFLFLYIYGFVVVVVARKAPYLLGESACFAAATAEDGTNAGGNIVIDALDDESR